MPSHQRIESFEMIRRIKRCGFVGGSVSLGVGFVASKAHARLSVSPSLPAAFE